MASDPAGVARRYLLGIRQRGIGGLTLDTNVNVILGLLCFSRILVGFGEGICVEKER